MVFRVSNNVNSQMMYIADILVHLRFMVKIHSQRFTRAFI